MSNLCLSRREIAEFSRSSTKVGQAAFLRDNGIRHYIDAHGWPVVLRSAVEGDDTAGSATPAWKSNKAA